MENDEILTPEDELEDLLYELFELDFDELEGIQEVEADVYTVLQQNPNNICGLIVLMFIEIMRGNRHKSQSLAYKIWEIGGELPPFFEMIYIENLLSLGLVEMAMILLKPRFEQLGANINDFYSVLLKFSVMTGNTSLLNRIAGFKDVAADDEELFAFADKFAQTNRGDVFKNLQKIILESIGESLCAYEYSVLDGEQLLVNLYINAEEVRCIVVQQQINQKIKAYLLSSNENDFEVVRVAVRSIKQHEAWLPDDAPEE